ncbi:GTPase family protein [Buttiauxella gaviniae]|uniref:GTPase family protein n=1 Tax=Buttiauxella gaviniae TaxID=82990 RepID=UPI0039B0BBC2
MSDKTIIDTLHSPLRILPADISQKLIQRLNEVIHYQPVIGIMGKTGAGKSSLCNALFRSPVSAVSHTSACTREPLRFTLQAGERKVTLIDLPGVGENLERDVEYEALYQRILPELDLVLWLIKADDRALTPDCDFYFRMLSPGSAGRDKVLFVLTQADKIEPSREWSCFLNQPSEQQQKHIEEKQRAVQSMFRTPSLPVIAVSSATGWHLPELVENLFQSLPARASSAFSSVIKQQYRTQKIEEQSSQDFGNTISDVMTQTLSDISLPAAVTTVLSSVINAVASAARSVWRFFF